MVGKPNAGGSAAAVGQRAATRAALPVEAVATAFPLATSAGLEMLRAGGNAVDAAVAAAWALCACEPSASGLGGQTIILLRCSEGSPRVIDGHSHAPAAASPESIGKEEQRRGHRATTVPTTPATLQYAHEKYGRLRRCDVMAPAIRIAEEGYKVTPLQHRQACWVASALDHSAAALYLPRGAPPPIDHVFHQPALAATLRRLTDLGAEDFYRGGIARSIAQDMASRGGLITEEDLANCGPPRECEPISTCYRGHRIVTVPRPGGGPQLLLALAAIERLLPAGCRATADEWRTAIALTAAAVFRERERSAIALPDRIATVLSGAFDSDCVGAIAAELSGAVRLPAAVRSGAEEPGDTTHLTVCDRYGNVVALTQSIQSLFGAKVAHPELGFLYNNYLRTCPRRPHPYGLASRCGPRSNATPTLVLRSDDDRAPPMLALGAAGSRRITSAILQVATGVIDQRLDIAAAVAAPRVHGLTSGKVWVEAPACSEQLLKNLEARGFRPIVKSRHSYSMGAVQALHFLPEGEVRGAADPRRDGTAETLPQSYDEDCKRDF